MHLKSPLNEDTREPDSVTPGTGAAPPVTPSSRSPSVDLAEMDSIVNTQDDVVRRYVGLRDGLQVLEREVSFIRTLNSGGGGQGRPLDQSKFDPLSSDEEEIDR